MAEGKENPQSAARAHGTPSAFEVWWAFAKIGAVLFGGGYAMLALLEREITVKRKWTTSAEMQNYFALAQLLPGVIAINASMLVGNRLRGWRGNIAAALGTVTVPFLCIAGYAAAYESVRSFPAVEAAMSGMRPAVAGMIAGLGLSMVRKSAKSPPALVLAVAVFAITVAFDPPIVAIIAAGVAAGCAWAFAESAAARRRGRGAEGGAK